jgi:hypothetical protein
MFLYSERLNLLSLLNGFRYYNYLIGSLAVILLFMQGNFLILLPAIILTTAGYWGLKVVFYIPDLFKLPASSFYLKQLNLIYFAFIFLSIILRTSLIVLWCYLILSYLSAISVGFTVPAIFLAYSIILIPLNLLTVEEVEYGNDEALYETIVLEIIFLLGMLLTILTDFDISDIILLSGLSILFTRILQFITELSYFQRTNNINFFH